MFQFNKSEYLIFPEKKTKCKLLALICLKLSHVHFHLSPKVLIPYFYVRSSMSNNEEERRVKARLYREMSQHYHRRPYKKIVTRKELSRANLTIEGAHNSAREEESSYDDDVEDKTYIPSPRAHPHGKGKGLASTSDSGVARDEIAEESEGDADNNGDEEEVFDVEDILPPSYVDMEALVFRVPQNPGWREKISYKGKSEAVREKRKIDA
jgi:hypothetical protein